MAEGRSAPSPTDAALVAAVVAGSEDALGVLYDRHAGAIHATAFRLTGDRQAAEDVVQEVILTLWNRAERFDPAVGSLAAWLGTMARNRAVDRLRAASRRPRLVSLAGPSGDEPVADALDRAAYDRTGSGPSDDRDDPSQVFEATEMRTVIDGVLAGMPALERDVILLAYRDELTQSEIAAQLGWPLGTVKTRTRRALARLRGALADVYGPQLAPVPLVEPDDEILGTAGHRPAGDAT